jgi:hypothetical protein
VSVWEAVREDRWQAWRRHRGMTRCATGTRGWVAFSSELSAGVPASAWPTTLA